MFKDSELKKAVLDELSWEPSVDAAHIGVTASAGVVTLTGHVDNYTHKFAAEKAVGRVKGVKAVAEEIEVQLPGHLKRGDEDIAAAAIGRLAWNSIVPAGAIQVKVEKGWVTLTGAVGRHFEKEEAEQDIRTISGVIGVSNEVSIRPKAIASNVKDDIEQALRRSSYHDTDTIHVNVVDGEIKLTGVVGTWNARSVAETTAWSAPGATSVKNDITVSY
jgi:osmotically-inducible protein OsmY